jgi:hypothetical protein
MPCKAASAHKADNPAAEQETPVAGNPVAAGKNLPAVRELPALHCAAAPNADQSVPAPTVVVDTCS